MVHVADGFIKRVYEICPLQLIHFSALSKCYVAFKRSRLKSSQNNRFQTTPVNYFKKTFSRAALIINIQGGCKKLKKMELSRNSFKMKIFALISKTPENVSITCDANNQDNFL